jgi:hypothetical protein
MLRESQYVYSGTLEKFRPKLTASSDLLAGSSNTDDDALTPALVAGLESAAHDVHVAGAVEGVVQAAVGHVHQPRLDGLALLQVLGRVDEVGGTELGRPLLLCLVYIHDNDLARLLLDRTLDDTQTNAASAEDSDSGALLDTALAGGDDGGTVTGGDTTAKQACAVHGSIRGDSDDGDVGHNGVLGEGRAAHEVEEILALALEARGAVRHHTLTLGRADGTAEVGLAGLAELALLALGGAADKTWLVNVPRLIADCIPGSLETLKLTARKGRQLTRARRRGRPSSRW